MQRLWKWLVLVLFVLVIGWAVSYSVEALRYRAHLSAIKTAAVDHITRAAIAARPAEMRKHLTAAQEQLEHNPSTFDVWLDVVDGSQEKVDQLADGTQWKTGSGEEVDALRQLLRSSVPDLRHARPARTSDGILIVAILISLAGLVAVLVWVAVALDGPRSTIPATGCP